MNASFPLLCMNAKVSAAIYERIKKEEEKKKKKKRKKDSLNASFPLLCTNAFPLLCMTAFKKKKEDRTPCIHEHPYFLKKNKKKYTHSYECLISAAMYDRI